MAFTRPGQAAAQAAATRNQDAAGRHGQAADGAAHGDDAGHPPPRRSRSRPRAVSCSPSASRTSGTSSARKRLTPSARFSWRPAGPTTSTRSPRKPISSITTTSRTTPPPPSFWARTATCKWQSVHPAFDGFEAGIVVYSEGQIVDREGSILYDGETLLGGWAKVYRKDRTRPGYDEVKLDEYNTGKSLWASKPRHHDPQGCAGPRPA